MKDAGRDEKEAEATNKKNKILSKAINAGRRARAKFRKRGLPSDYEHYR